MRKIDEISGEMLKKKEKPILLMFGDEIVLVLYEYLTLAVWVILSNMKRVTDIKHGFKTNPYIFLCDV